MSNANTHSVKALLLTSIAAVTFASQPVFASEENNFNIEAKSLGAALSEFSLQSGQNVLFSSDIVRGKEAKSINGVYDSEQALRILLEDSGLIFSETENGTWLINEVPMQSGPSGSTQNAGNATPPSASNVSNTSSTPEPEGNPIQLVDSELTPPRSIGKRLIDTIVTEGSRNTALRRLETDPLPFTVFDRNAIELSNTNSLGEFLTRNLNANTSANGANNSINGGLAGRGRSNVALRGLSDRETLILVDGRRIAENRTSGGAIAQPDINGIPLGAIERVEVLPSSASGIYGGGATGGVINIVLRRDYTGLDVALSHDTTTRFDYSETRFDVNGATSISDRTNVNFSASYRDGTELSVSERSFLEDARNTTLRNNPDAILGNALIASTPNIVSPASFFGPGPDLTLVGGGALNSMRTFVPVGYGGISSDAGAALIANAGTLNLAPSQTAQRGGGGNLLQSSPKSISFLGSINHEFSENLTGFVEGSYSNNKSSSPSNTANGAFFVAGGTPGNPFNENIFVSVPVSSPFQFESEIETLRLGVGGTYEIIPDDWFVSADITWNETTTEDMPAPLFDNSAFGAAIASGTVNPFVDTGSPADYSSFFLNEVSTQTPSKATLTNISVRSGGSLPISLPGGDITLNMSGEFRDENYDSIDSENLSLDFFGSVVRETVFTPKQSQKVLSFYAEAQLPLVSPENEIAGIHALDLQIAGRVDDYDIDAAIQNSSFDPSIAGGGAVPRTELNYSEFSPTVAIKYSPVSDLSFRGSYAEGFLPPSVLSLSPILAPNFTTSTFFGFFGTGDPLRGGELLGSNNGLGGVEVFGGGSPDLLPERTKSYSAGLIFEPKFIESLRLSADWTKIDKTDGITTLVSFDPNDVATLITLRPDRITRIAPAAGDPFADGPITAINSRLINLASQTIETLDVSLDYRFDIGALGDFLLKLDVTRNLTSDEQVTPAADIVSTLGFGDFIKTRATASLDWGRNNWHVRWASQYYGGYEIDPDGFGNAGRIISQGPNGIDDQMYHDLIVSYSIGSSGKWSDTPLKNTKFELAAINIFDKAPSFDATQLNSTGVSVYGDPRRARLRLTVKKTF